MYTCRISVHELVETSYLQGSLTSQGMSAQRAQLGARIHRMLQSKRGKNYQSEVFFRHESVLDDITIIVEGRADGIEISQDQIIVEEIKSSLLPFEQIDDSVFVHFAQCYVYAHFCLLEHPQRDDITIRLTYVQAESGREKPFTRTLTRSELEAFYAQLLENYRKWAVLRRDLHINARTSAKALRFPFPHYRDHQREFAAWVYQTITSASSLIVQAPTGIGKTVSTLFPALKALGEGKCEKIFYLCAKNMTSAVARSTMRLFYEQDLSLKTVFLTAKDKICPFAERKCDECPYADNYYGRLRPILYRLLNECQELDGDVFTRYGEENALCPFELSLDAAMYAAVIVCDYNYVFDPAVYLRRFFEEKGSYVFLIDEAHNLVERVREMYSADLWLEELRTMNKLMKSEAEAVHDKLRPLEQYLQRLSERCQGELCARKAPMDDLSLLLNRLIDACDLWLQLHPEAERRDVILEIYFHLVSCRRIFELYDESFITWYENDAKGGFHLRLYCMNPAARIQERLSYGKAVIYFSATLSPSLYHATLLGEQDKARRIALPSVFSEDQYAVIIHGGISTRWQHRDASAFQIVNAIYHSIIPKSGNYIVFFPSYRYMERCAKLFSKHCPDITLHVQSAAMTPQERQAFLSRFETTDQLQVHFCVLGGMFSEGIDFSGERLIGAIIVGVGLPMINPESDFVKEHFDAQGKPGYHFAYTFPGMNKVLQAMGRVIRTKKDSGIIVLLDDRYLSPLYRSLFPAHYRRTKQVFDNLQLEAQIRAFWESRSEQ